MLELNLKTLLKLFTWIYSKDELILSSLGSNRTIYSPTIRTLPSLIILWLFACPFVLLLLPISVSIPCLARYSCKIMVCRLESILFICDFIKRKWETKGQKERLQERRFYCLRTKSMKRGISHGILSTMKKNFIYNQRYWFSLALLFAIWFSLRRNHYLGVLQFHSIWEVNLFNF